MMIIVLKLQEHLDVHECQDGLLSCQCTVFADSHSLHVSPRPWVHELLTCVIHTLFSVFLMLS